MSKSGVIGSGFGIVLACALLTAAWSQPAQAEKVLRMAHDLSMGGKESLDPLSPVRFWEVNDLLYNRLVRLNEKGEIEPELAASWTPNDSATEWTIKLQEGVRFHDGSPLGASDVKYSLERINDPALESPVTSVLGMIDHVEVIDALTAKIVLSAKHAGLPILLSDYRVRIIPDGSGATIEQTGIGSGPFKLEEYDPEGRTILVANPDYWEGAPKLDRIEYLAISDADARAQALLAGQIDFSRVAQEQGPLFAGNPKFVLSEFPSGGWFGIVFRTDVAPFTDPRVRKAVRIAANREEMVKLLAGEGHAIVTCDNPVKASDPYRADLDCPQDTELAKSLLAEAGFADGIDIDLHTSNLETGMVRFAEVYQQQVAKAGIRVKLVIAPGDGYWDDVWMKETVVVTSWDERPADQILNEAYRSGSSWNESYFSSPEFDALLDKARASLDFAEAKQAMVEAQRMLFETGGTFIPYQQNVQFAYDKSLTGITPVIEDQIRWDLVDKAEE
ncbi:MAG: ABC transporter substrate-binding protein [Rhodospirillaceae bacterium]|nr:ABC transporter substrate-binding protein [Rhodospirillaceae bacterium]